MCRTDVFGYFCSRLVFTLVSNFGAIVKNLLCNIGKETNIVIDCNNTRENIDLKFRPRYMYTVLSRGGVVLYIILVYCTSRNFAHVRSVCNLKVGS